MGKYTKTIILYVGMIISTYIFTINIACGQSTQEDINQTHTSLQVNMNCMQFEYTNDSAYIELQFLFLGHTLQYQQIQDNKYRANIQVNATFISKERNDTNTITHNYFSATYDTPKLIDKENFYDLLRIPLLKGKYQMDLEIVDKNANNKPILYTDVLDLTFDNNIVCLSSIQPLSYLSRAENHNRYIKEGWDYTPYFSTYYPEIVNSFTFWVEIYHSDKINSKSDSFIVYSAIVAAENPQTPVFKLSKQKIFNKKSQVSMQQIYNIDSLPSGNYYLVLEIRDENDTIHAYSSYFFQRYNPISIPFSSNFDTIPYDTLKRYFDYISVLANPAEIKFIDNFTSEQQEDGLLFFYNFWKNRNPADPQKAWYDFHLKVMQVNNNYSTLSYKGYKTDRGQCYLKYGPPSEIEYHNFDGNTYPYEIWYYNTVPNGQVNVYFVFYNLDRTTKDYRLLHSTVYGEAKYPQWEEEVKYGKTLMNQPNNNTFDQ